MSLWWWDNVVTYFMLLKARHHGHHSGCFMLQLASNFFFLSIVLFFFRLFFAWWTFLLYAIVIGIALCGNLLCYNFFKSTKHRCAHCVLQPFIVVVEFKHYHCGHCNSWYSGTTMCYTVFCCSRTLGVVVDHQGGHCGSHLVCPTSCW